MTEECKIYITPEEILAAFEDNTAIVFELSRERTPSAKSNLFGGIWQINPEAINPEAIITEADLCVMSVESTAHDKQILVIDKGGDKDTVVKKMNLIIDGGNLLVTVRNLSSSDHETIKNNNTED